MFLCLFIPRIYLVRFFMSCVRLLCHRGNQKYDDVDKCHLRGARIKFVLRFRDKSKRLKVMEMLGALTWFTPTRTSRFSMTRPVWLFITWRDRRVFTRKTKQGLSFSYTVSYRTCSVHQGKERKSIWVSGDLGEERDVHVPCEEADMKYGEPVRQLPLSLHCLNVYVSLS